MGVMIVFLVGFCPLSEQKSTRMAIMPGCNGAGH
jgi:hypothetical protein